MVKGSLPSTFPVARIESTISVAACLKFLSFGKSLRDCSLKFLFLLITFLAIQLTALALILGSTA